MLPGRTKCAWLVEPGCQNGKQLNANVGMRESCAPSFVRDDTKVELGCAQSERRAASVQAGWRIAPDTIDADQFKRQTEGWPASWDAIKMMLREQGPFDGCLGFSQVGCLDCLLW